MTRYLLAILAILLLHRWLRPLLASRRGATAAKTAPHAEASLVRDPECGVYIARGQALVEGRGAAALHFCSERCRERHAARAVAARPGA